jgi:hypothetical protein
MSDAETKPAGVVKTYLLREGLAECARLLGNYSDALALAAERGADATAGIHLKQARLVLLEGIALFKQLRPDEAEAAE